MSLIMVEYVKRGWLWVALRQPTIGNISLGQDAYLIIVSSSRVDKMMDWIACIDESTTGPVSPPPRY